MRDGYEEIEIRHRDGLDIRCVWESLCISLYIAFLAGEQNRITRISSSAGYIALDIVHLREAGQDRFELVDDLLLNGHIIDSRLVICVSRADGYIAAASPQQDDICLPWQTRAAAPVRITAAQETCVDAGEDVLELAWVAAPVVLDLGEVDVEESVVG
jgi:hypothetical protein